MFNFCWPVLVYKYLKLISVQVSVVTSYRISIWSNCFWTLITFQWIQQILLEKKLPSSLEMSCVRLQGMELLVIWPQHRAISVTRGSTNILSKSSWMVEELILQSWIRNNNRDLTLNQQWISCGSKSCAWFPVVCFMMSTVRQLY